MLGFYDPLQHKLEADVEVIKNRVANGSQMSERVAKLLYKDTNDQLFQKFFTMKDKKRLPKNADKK